RRPGLKHNHFLGRKMGKEGERGSIAKRWSRRTRSDVEGRIEFRGVGLVYPVGGEPGAQAKIARSGPAREAVKAGRARVKRELLAETNEPDITSELSYFLAPSHLSHRKFPNTKPNSSASSCAEPLFQSERRAYPEAMPNGSGAHRRRELLKCPARVDCYAG